MADSQDQIHIPTQVLAVTKVKVMIKKNTIKGYFSSYQYCLQFITLLCAVTSTFNRLNTSTAQNGDRSKREKAFPTNFSNLDFAYLFV